MENGFSPSVVYYASDPQTMMLMVNAGRGLAFLSSRLSRQKLEGVKFLDITDCNLDFDVVLAYKNSNTNPMIPLFISQFQDA